MRAAWRKYRAFERRLPVLVLGWITFATSTVLLLALGRDAGPAVLTGLAIGGGSTVGIRWRRERDATRHEDSGEPGNPA
jgi:hypothetical protein